MKPILLTLLVALVAAASLIVIVDRLQDPGPVGLRDLDTRLARIEQCLAAVPDADPGTAGWKPVGEQLADVERRLQEVEAMVFDAERALRRDLQLLFRRLLERMDELQASGGTGAGEQGAAQRVVREKLAEMGVKVDADQKRLELQGRMGDPDHPLELAGVAPGGRADEALLVLDLVPSALKIALEDLGLREVGPPDPNTFQFPEDADGVYVYVLWEGLKKPRRLEDMILDQETLDTLPRTRWLFTASRFYTDTRTWDRHFAADVHKNLIALTRNYAEDAILACPLEKSIRENIWFPFEDGVPDVGTPVKVIMTLEPVAEWDTI